MPSIGESDVSSLIEEEVANEIISNVAVQSAAMASMRRMRMSTSQTRLPVMSALPSAAFVSSGGGLKGTSKAAWDKKELIAEEIAVIIPIPESYLEDASFDIWGEIRPHIEGAFAQKIDLAVLFGIDKPATWGTDILAHAAAAGNSFTRGSVANQDVAGDISDTMALAENDGYDINGFASRRNLRASLRNLRDQNGTPIFTASLEAGSSVPGIWGEPLRYVSNGSWDAANADLLTGDWTQAIMATRQDLTFKILTEASLYDDQGQLLYALAQQDMVAMRVVGRFAYQVANAVNREGDLADQSPFSVLRPTGWTP